MSTLATWRRCALTLGLTLGLTLPLGSRPAEAQVAPDDPWRTVETEHFRVTFPAGLEPLAARAGVRAEAAYSQLSRDLVPIGAGRVDILLTDHVDVSNGLAGMSPWRRILIYARPPTDAAGLQYFDEWMELVVTHEMAHIAHLDHQGTLARITRTIFGRPPASWPFFPNAMVPRWTTEGLATWYESNLSGAGRVKGTDHQMVVRTAALEGTLEDLGQAGGDSPVWPGGNRYYVYGGQFLADLVARQGEDGLPGFVEAISGQWIPLRINSASREGFDQSFSQAWTDWVEGEESHADATVERLTRTTPATEPVILEPTGWEQLYPRILGDGVVFSRADRRADPQIRQWTPGSGTDGSGGTGRKLLRTNGLSTLDTGTDGTVVFAQLEYLDPYRIRSDLYVRSPDGQVRRLTRNARLSHPSIAPEGDRVVAVQEGEGTNRLVLVDLPSGELVPLTPFDAEVHWTMPSWSPDPGRIAVSRWVPGGLWDLGLIDPDTGIWTPLTRDRALDMSPTWTPDGHTILWASDRTGVPNIFAVTRSQGGGWSPPKQVTNMLAGAATPATDGEWLYFSAYGADGWDMGRIPYDPRTWFEPQETDPRFLGHRRTPPPFDDDSSPAATGPGTAPDTSSEAPEYRALRWALPRYWLPLYTSGEENRGTRILGRGVGAFTGGTDLVGRHAWDASLIWRPDGGLTDWRLGYTFAGLGTPVLGASVAQRWDAAGPFGLPSGDEIIPVSLEERERSAGVSVTLPRPRYRTFSSATASASLVRSETRVRQIGGDLLPSGILRRPLQTLGQLGLYAVFANHRSHPFSVSREDGVRLEVRGRVRQDLTVADSLTGVVGWDGSFDDLFGRASGYWAFDGPGFASHVLAGRISAGYAQGAGADAFHFDLGGATGQGIPGLNGLGGTSLLFPLRGYASGVRNGSRAVSASAEYRFPIAILHKGLGAFPLHLDRLMGDLFIDAGNAWGPELGVPGFQNPWNDWLLSAGGEVRLRLTPFWAGGLDVRAGLAFPLVDGDGAGFYLRLGPSF